MKKENKDEKIQVLLSSTDHRRLKTIILNKSLASGKIMTSSSYVRDLILDHIEETEGDQSSFDKNEIKKIYNETKNQ